ncbi:MAG: terminase TerL endonuclease subunit [Acidimicrobiales bacterium]
MTTADEGDVGTVYDERRREIEAMATGSIDWDPSIFGAIWCISETDDPFDESVWVKANPNLGVSKTWDYMRRQAAKARRTPSYLPTFERLDLGLRRKSDVTWFPMDLYGGCSHRASIDDLDGQVVHGAIDLSAVDDFTALVWWCPGEVHVPAFGDDRARWREGGIVIARVWCTEAGVARRPRMARQLEQWAGRAG